MYQKVKFAAVGLVALALTACSSGGSMPSLHSNGTQSIHQVSGGVDTSKVHIMRTMNSTAPFANPNNNNLQYYGGPVEVKAHIYIVFWGFNVSGSDPSGEQTYLTALMNGVGGSSWMRTDNQYYQIVSGVTTHIKNPTGMLKGTWVDPSSVPSAPNDAQIRAEAASAEAHFGYNKNGNYIVATPHNHNSPGFGTQYCAYHSPTSSGGGEISYTDLPYMTDAGQNCGENSVNPGTKGLLDGVSIVAGHEQAESQTDPQVNLNTAWAGRLGENGDACAWQGLGNVVLSTGTFAMQPLWSNAISGCALHTP
jgi:serine protease